MFDFEGLQRKMVRLKLEWTVKVGSVFEARVPGIFELRQEARKLLEQVAEHDGKEWRYSHSCGGFEAERYNDPTGDPFFVLRFVLDEVGSHWFEEE